MKKINLLITGLVCLCYSIADAQILARGQTSPSVQPAQTGTRSLDKVLLDLEKEAFDLFYVS